MKKIHLISFTAAGLELERRLISALQQYGPEDWVLFPVTRYRHGNDTACPDSMNGEIPDGAAPGKIRFAGEGLAEWAGEAMGSGDILLFIGAAGIAVRTIAPYVRDKLKDPAVLVMDERGNYVISLLSGHVGGANAFAALIADVCGALPVITTATDINGAFSADLFAKENHLQIVNRSAIAAVSTKAIEEKPVRLCIEGFPPQEKPDVALVTHQTYQSATDQEKRAFFTPGTLVLCPKRYALGMGCKKGMPAERLEEVFREILEITGIEEAQIGALCSIDIKSEEPGLLELSAKHRLPFLTFSAEVLRNIPGDYSGSGFVQGQVGVDNVCERSAMAAVGTGGTLILKKQVRSGITAAVAERSGNLS